MGFLLQAEGVFTEEGQRLRDLLECKSAPSVPVLGITLVDDFCLDENACQSWRRLVTWWSARGSLADGRENTEIELAQTVRPPSGPRLPNTEASATPQQQPRKYQMRSQGKQNDQKSLK